MQHSLETLGKVYTPSIIFDIGACYGNWTHMTKKIYPDTFYYLFEPIEYDELIQFNNDLNVSVHHVLLDETVRLADWYEMKNTGDSMFKENTSVYKDCIPKKKQTTTLNNVFSRKFTDSDDIFIKIDCQGAEIPILKGAGDILNHTSFILLELPFFGIYSANHLVCEFLQHQMLSATHWALPNASCTYT